MPQRKESLKNFNLYYFSWDEDQSKAAVQGKLYDGVASNTIGQSTLFVLLLYNTYII